MTKKQGGKRPGAGRKPLPEGQRKVPYATKLPRRVVEYLQQSPNAAKAIELGIVRSKGYREWLKISD